MLPITRSYSFSSGTSLIKSNKRLSRLIEEPSGTMSASKRLALQLLELISNPPRGYISIPKDETSKKNQRGIKKQSSTLSFSLTRVFSLRLSKRPDSLDALQTTKYSSLHVCLCNMEQQVGFFGTFHAVLGQTATLPKLKEPVSNEIAEVLMLRANEALSRINKVHRTLYTKVLQEYMHTIAHDIFADTAETAPLVNALVNCWKSGAPFIALNAARSNIACYECEDKLTLLSEQGNPLIWEEIPSRIACLNVRIGGKKGPLQKLGEHLAAPFVYGLKMALLNLPEPFSCADLLGKVQFINGKHKICMKEKTLLTLLTTMMISLDFYPTHPETNKARCFNDCSINGSFRSSLKQAEESFRKECSRYRLMAPGFRNYPYPDLLPSSSFLPSKAAQKERAQRWINGQESSLDRDI